MTIFGIDTSHYDWDRGPMNVAAMVEDGIVFFSAKCTEGTSYKDNRFGEGVKRARDAGIDYIGAYHVVRTGPSAQAQANYTIAWADQVAPWWREFPGWFWQADLEIWEYDSVSASAGEAYADAIQNSTGRVCLMYASAGQYGNSLQGTSHHLWNANYGSNPDVHYREAYPGDSSSRWNAYSGKTPKLLQYGSRTIIGGQHTCDANAFRGTIEEFAELVGAEVDMQQNEELAYNTDLDGRTIGNTLADLQNERSYLYDPAGAGQPSGGHYPATGSRLDTMVRAAEKILNRQSQPEGETMSRLAGPLQALVAALVALTVVHLAVLVLLIILVSRHPYLY